MDYPDQEVHTEGTLTPISEAAAAQLATDKQERILPQEDLVE
jgi:hypothetical protein